jgi:hypothetical protein
VPLPPSLQVVPVFGTSSSRGDGAADEAKAEATGAGGLATIVALLGSVGRALTSKAVAYALAGACAAAFLGLVVSQHEWQLPQQPVSSGYSASPTSRRAGRVAVTRTSVHVAGGSSGRVGEPTGNTHVAVGSPVAATPDAQGLGTPALALLSPLASDRRQIGSPPTLSDGAASGGGAAVHSGAARAHHKAGKEDHARVRGGSGSRHADRGVTRASGGNGRHSRVNKHSREARQKPRPHRTKTGDKQKA